MSILPITLYGDKILKKKARKVTEIDNKVIELIRNMFETMEKAQGIGLAANQVGSDKSIFVIDVSKLEGHESTKKLVVINPKIIELSDETIVIEEGCLSMPDVRFEVERPEKIKIRFYDTDLNEHILDADDILARVMQHEYDHLKGIFFTERLAENIQKKLKKDLNRIKKRKVETDYPVTDDPDYQLI